MFHPHKRRFHNRMDHLKKIMLVRKVEKKQLRRFIDAGLLESGIGEPGGFGRISKKGTSNVPLVGANEAQENNGEAAAQPQESEKGRGSIIMRALRKIASFLRPPDVLV